MKTRRRRRTAFVATLTMAASLLVAAAFPAAAGAQTATPSSDAAAQSGASSSAKTGPAVVADPARPRVPMGSAVANRGEQPFLSDLSSSELAERASNPVGVPAGVAVRPAAATGAEAPSAVTTWNSFAYSGWFPPDSQTAVGPSDGIAAVNGGLKIFNKSGTALSTWSSLGGFFPNSTICGASSCSSNFRVFDPWVVYDNLSNRFVVHALVANTSTKTSRLLLAISDNSTAQGSFIYYGANVGDSSVWADYGKVGISSNAVVVTLNMFGWTSGFSTAKVVTFWKSQIYSGTTATYWSNWSLSGNPFTLQPTNSTVNSTTMYLVNASSGGGSSVALRTLVAPASPGSPTISAPTSKSVTSYTAQPTAVQKGSATNLSTGDSRMLQAVRTNAGIFAVHTTGCTLTGGVGTFSCARLYQFSTSYSVLQSMTWGITRGNGTCCGFLSFPGIAANDSGSLVMPFQYSSSSDYMSAAYTARKSTDALNTLQSWNTFATGQGCYVQTDSQGRNRNGDYSGASWDKSTGRFWVMGQNSVGTSATCTNNRWGTRIAVVPAP